MINYHFEDEDYDDDDEYEEVVVVRRKKKSGEEPETIELADGEEIVKVRKNKKIETTQNLVDIILEATPRIKSKIL